MKNLGQHQYCSLYERLVRAAFSRVSSIPYTNAAEAARTFGATILIEQYWG